jgi:glyoxylase-like metal-dependent hydrolase (beta-lactamase superfamily II)
MRRLLVLSVACVLAAAGMPSAQGDAVKTAADALGAANIKTLGFAGSGANFSLGQNFTPNDPWPRVPVTTYTALINFDTASMRTEILREMGATMPRGGGAPFFGQQRQNQQVSGDYAWNVPVPNPPPAGAAPAGPPAGGPPAAAPAAPPAAPAPGNQVERMLFIWSTPQGFVKGAMANNAAQKAVPAGTEVSFTVAGKYKVVGIINGKGEVEKVQTWIDQSIVGDMLVETTYSDYKKFGTVMFPAHIAQTQDGFPTLDLNIAAVSANMPVDIAVPDNVRNAPASAPVTVTSEKLADGVYYLTGGTHHSLAIEMKDHIILVDTPNNEARAQAVIDKTKELIPKKPIRYVVTSHHHWDHLGGIRTAMAEGATIVTYNTNKAFLERVAKTPHTINPDKLSMMKNPKPVKVQAMMADSKLTDGTRTVELHLLTGYEHTGDMLVVYLPKEKILAEPDAFTPPAMAGTPLIPPAVPYAAALYDNIQRLKLDVQAIAPFHGARKTDVAEVAKAAGRAGANTN